MQRNQFRILTSFAPAILLVTIYLLVNPVAAQMMFTPTPTPNPVTNNSSILLVIVGAVIIILIAIILFFVYSKRNAGKSNAEIARSTNPTVIERNLSIGKEKMVEQYEATKPFDVFLCYKKSSGKDYADHLKSGLEELGLHTFEDCKDIPLTVNTEEGWACDRDKALEESKYFVLIMTPGFELSSEVVKEIGMARKQGNKTFVFFRHRSLGRKIVVNLGTEILDIGKLEQVSFENKEELLRLAHSILLKPKTS